MTLYNFPPIFIVGSSRSGTTMLMRMFAKHPDIASINEPHFFDRFYSSNSEQRVHNQQECADILLQLVSEQKDGFFAPRNEDYKHECWRWLEKHNKHLTSLELYKCFHSFIQKDARKLRFCEKTPQNVFYIKELLLAYPTARILHMVRDPRAVLASQKNKWRRRQLGSDFMPKKEVIRLRFNYHPILAGRLWNSSISAGKVYEQHKQVMEVRYEDLVAKPEDVVRQICLFTDLNFDANMLEIAVASSSTRPDQPHKNGVSKDSLDTWRKVLSNAELAILQSICKDGMKRHAYEPLEVKGFLTQKLLLWIWLPFKMALALIGNFKRFKSISQYLKVRAIIKS
ncbi:MAG: sulfotransferase [Bacteroidetes bacterium]|nr:sulfotransferase [Bacteroidota bacterium]